MRYAQVYSYKINEEKSMMIGLNIFDKRKNQISQISKAIWKEKDVFYLGRNISGNLKDILECNVIPVLKVIARVPTTVFSKWQAFAK